jgi:hypothetical protein
MDHDAFSRQNYGLKFQNGNFAFNPQSEMKIGKIMKFRYIYI